MNDVKTYLGEIQEKHRTAIAREHAYRPALQALLESDNTDITAVNDPARDKIGMPDFVVLRKQGNVPIGIVEAKDIGNQLNRTEKTKQFKRYMAHNNLILTNYLEFRWYVDGEKREAVRIARIKQGKIIRIPSAYSDLNDLLRRFVERKPSNINSARDLAERLARHAQLIAHFIEKDLKSNEPSKNLENQMAAFANTLIPDLDATKFADMYAQTLAYGLFASRVNYPGEPAQFSLSGAAEYIPRTNPFLRRLFHINSFDLGSRLTWLVDGLVDVLRHTDMDSILAHFGQRTGQTDPVVHFYETFLSSYDPTLREKRGVYYTPEPVVKYIVRSVDHILKTRFDRSDGLADKDTLILDPAVGTGTFLFYVIERIKERFAGQRGMWKGYVEERLLPRIFGFELLMAPYTIAHMNLGLQLKEAGYEFKEDERLGIYLTNSLEEGIQQGYATPFGGFLVDEANTAAEIKRDKPIMVVLGNPPYSGHSANRSEIEVDEEVTRKRDGKLITVRRKNKVNTFIGNLVEDYKKVDGEKLNEKNSQGIQDDYVKFLRFAQWRIEKTGVGIVAFVTNHSFLTSPTLRGMRRNLMTSFSEIFLLNLHGNVRTRELTPGGDKDDNVFDIQQGVSICILVKHKNFKREAVIHYADLWGSRQHKYNVLASNHLLHTDWSHIDPTSPFYIFASSDQSNVIEYSRLPAIINVFPVSSNGFKTHRDHFAVAFTSEDMQRRVGELLEPAISDQTLQSTYALRDNSDWELKNTRELLRQDDRWQKRLVNCAYRPFDVRVCLYGDYLMDRSRIKSMRHLLHENMALSVGRQGQAVGGGAWNLTLVGDLVADTNLFYRGGIQYLPVYLYPDPDQFEDAGDDISEYPLSHKGRRPNLSKAFVAEMEAKLGLPFQTEGSAFTGGDSPDWFGPEDIFYYAYAVFHSPTYRERYAEFLKIDYPRLPLISDVLLFETLVKLGAELVSLHLMKSPKLLKRMTTYNVAVDDKSLDNVVSETRDFPNYVEKGGQVYINKTQYFEGVPQEIWDFHIGGYQVLHKWLKDRRGRVLSTGDLEHYQQIVVALSETIRIMRAIDEAIPQFPIE